jgi:quercetin dioxygenase-like cupin family protein
MPANAIVPRVVLAALFGFAAGAFAHAVAQPPNRTGVTWTQLGEIDLGAELGDAPIAGRALRGRLVTLPPGGVVPTHSHNDRPSVMYMVEGTATERRGDTVIEHHPGEGFRIGKATPHLMENRTSARAAYVEVDVYRK